MPCTALHLALILVLIANVAAAAERMNVVFIICDDLNNDLGAYGFDQAQTPHLDRLAGEGVRFDRAYCQFPLCSPSRSSMLSGLRPDRIGIYDLKVHFRKQHPDLVTLPQCFRSAGYTVERVGKLYHQGVPGGIGTDGLDDPASWDRVSNPKGRDKTDEGKLTYAVPGTSPGGNLCWMVAEGTDEEQTDGLVATEAIRRMGELKERPFVLAVGFYRPHTPYVATRPWFDLHPLDGIDVLTATPEDLAQYPAPAFWTKKANYGVEEAIRAQAIQAYRAAVSFVDAQVGRVVAEVDRLGLRERTVIVFTSDHGYLLGQHGQWQKQSLFEESARVPLVIRAPGVVAGVSPRTVELVDLYPTLASLCQVPAPAGLDGDDLAPLLADPQATWDHPAYTQVQRSDGRSVRTERWRYTEWKGGEEGRELYDHDADPRELRNLAGDPAHAETVAELSRLLAAGR